MGRRVVISGLGTVSGFGLGVDDLWSAVMEGRSAIDTIKAFDPSGFPVQIGAEVPDFKVNKIVPKSYRKATKVMARDIEFAVAAADLAVRDAGLITPGIDDSQPRSYEGPRTGAHIGAGLIAAELNELTTALKEARWDNGEFDIHLWGSEGINHLTPLWLLKYLPNMLACHVTIIHDSQGPSNTITCGEASSGLSIGESLRVIQRDKADLCFCGGCESKVNLMAFYRQILTGRLSTDTDRSPGEVVRPFDTGATGSAVGEGGGIVMLESLDTARERGAKAYAEVVGFGAGHTVYPQSGGLEPDPAGKGMVVAMRAALRDAALSADAIDAIVAFGAGTQSYDNAEAAALKTIFGDALPKIPIWSSKPYVGNCGAGAGSIDFAIAAKMLSEQAIPARINCDNPIDGLNAKSSGSQSADLNHVMITSTSLGGQNVALILRKYE